MRQHLFRTSLCKSDSTLIFHLNVQNKKKCTVDLFQSFSTDCYTIMHSGQPQQFDGIFLMIGAIW